MALVADLWEAEGWQIEIRPTEAPAHATEIAQEAAAKNHRVVLAVGGDGTLGEVANGLAHTRTALAPLPAGTTNSFGRELRMPLPSRLSHQNLLQAAQSLLQGRIHAMDMGFSYDANGNGRYWMLWTGVGFDGYMVDKIEPRPRWSKRLGKTGYFMQAFTALPGVPKMKATVTVDGRSCETESVLVLISNCRLYGGYLNLNPDAHLDDGLLDIWLFQGNSLIDTARYAIETRFNHHWQNPDLIHMRGRSVQVQTSPEMKCQTDGDKAGETPLHCEIKPGVLQLLLPSTAPQLFLQPGEPL